MLEYSAEGDDDLQLLREPISRSEARKNFCPFDELRAERHYGPYDESVLPWASSSSDRLRIPKKMNRFFARRLQAEQNWK